MRDRGERFRPCYSCGGTGWVSFNIPCCSCTRGRNIIRRIKELKAESERERIERDTLSRRS